MLLHEVPDFADLIAVTAREHGIDPGLVEKDYWIMHGLWGLQHGGFTFELKGGTSLSKGYGLIHRFSEDIDILIHPDDDLPTGPNQNKPAHRAARRAFYDSLAERISIPGFHTVERATEFDNQRYSSGGIRLRYTEINPLPPGVKTGILLEAGFDQVAPNRPCHITSWAYEKALKSGVTDITDNRAVDVPCYEPGYTLVEKLQTISKKFRNRQASGDMPQNFLRHYYDVYCLLADAGVQDFIGTDDYQRHKAKRFRRDDERDLTRNEAFLLSDEQTRAAYVAAFAATRALYYREQPSLDEILRRIRCDLARL